tara:strand:- start:328 stop:627 length:300 start_codon:yes stop_codon:yes gene_type:complete
LLKYKLLHQFHLDQLNLEMHQLQRLLLHLHHHLYKQKDYLDHKYLILNLHHFLEEELLEEYYHILFEVDFDPALELLDHHLLIHQKATQHSMHLLLQWM